MLYDVIGEQLGGAMSAVVEKLRVMEKEGLLREGKQSFITMSWSTGKKGQNSPMTTPVAARSQQLPLRTVAKLVAAAR